MPIFHSSILIALFVWLTFPIQLPAVSYDSLQDALPLKKSIDLDLDFGLSLNRENSESRNSLVSSRFRIGRQWMRDSRVLSLGADLGKWGPWNLGAGLEGEWLDISTGLWIQGKVLSTQKELWVTGLSVGWSLFGIEGLLSPLNSSQKIVLAKVRFPIGFLIR